MHALALIGLLLAATPAAPRDPGFQAIMERVGQQSHDASVAQMEAWVDAHPHSPDAGRGVVWMAEIRIADHRFREALRYFQRAQHDYVGSEWGLQGAKGVADVDEVLHRYAPAIATYEALAKQADPYWHYVGRTDAATARARRVRWYAFLALTWSLILGVSLRIVRARRGLWPVPAENIYALPVAAVMLLAALGQPAPEAHGLMVLTLGGMILIYAHAVHLRAHPPRLWLSVTEALLGIAEAAALLYCTVITTGLWDKFSETLSHGADR